MKQREVTDKQNTRWTCVQAYAGLEGKVSEKVAEMTENNEGEIPVICTPSGGEQSVRLQLAKDWEDISDEALINAIESSK